MKSDKRERNRINHFHRWLFVQQKDSPILLTFRDGLNFRSSICPSGQLTHNCTHSLAEGRGYLFSAEMISDITGFHGQITTSQTRRPAWLNGLDPTGSDWKRHLRFGIMLMVMVEGYCADSDRLIQRIWNDKFEGRERSQNERTSSSWGAMSARWHLNLCGSQ
jgi:hypothetical protein